MNRTNIHPDRLVLTYTEAAQVLEVCPRTIWALVDAGEISAARIGRRSVRIPRAELERFLAAQTRNSQQGGAA